MPYRRLIFFGAVAVALPACFLYGFLSGATRLPPYPWLTAIRQRLQASGDARFTAVPAEFANLDLHPLMRLASSTDVSARRAQITELLWHRPDVPHNRMPDRVERGVSDPRFADLKNLSRIDRLTVTMEYGVDSVVYLLHPLQARRGLVIYHEGHEGNGDIRQGKATVQFFLARGYTVAAFALPLLGENSRPVVALPTAGSLQLTLHQQFALLSGPEFTPLKFFVEPVVAVLNFAQDDETLAPIAMVGISGGGWVTELVAAVDPRITASYPVAGSLPIALRTPDEFWDWEEYAPELFAITNELEIYALGAVGAGRRQLQIFNQYDPCCFSGVRFRQYDTLVAQTVTQL
ncbi:MAG: hypothetical protein PHI63_05285, partial [Patescibacteria group bacterium]|nr:hypothetical protein [Patescibacteria group bacterium]